MRGYFTELEGGDLCGEISVYYIVSAPDESEGTAFQASLLFFFSLWFGMLRQGMAWAADGRFVRGRPRPRRRDCERRHSVEGSVGWDCAHVWRGSVVAVEAGAVVPGSQGQGSVQRGGLAYWGSALTPAGGDRAIAR